MLPIKNNRLIRALQKQPVDCTPVWLMRQAGRYLPEYRALRAKAGDFMSLCQTPELACEVTLQPLRRFPLDAAILFSDILTIPDAMGLGLNFVSGEGPVFERPLRTESDIQQLNIPDPEGELRYVMDAVRLIKQSLNGEVPLIGFAGSPWTLASYMVEGGSSKTFSQIKALLYQSPRLLHQLLTTLASSVTLYLNAQIAAGADVVMLFDTWGGQLTTPHYLQFSLAYLQQIVAGLSREHEGRYIPVIVFTKGGGLWLEAMATIDCDALSLDWTINLADAMVRVGDKVALQGNLDPGALYGTDEALEAAIKQILLPYGSKPGHVFNLGHGVSPDVNPDKVALLVNAVHQFSAR